MVKMFEKSNDSFQKAIQDIGIECWIWEKIPDQDEEEEQTSKKIIKSNEKKKIGRYRDSQKNTLFL